MHKKMAFCSMILFLGASLCFAQGGSQPEEISITTYYPSPFGSYNELEINRSITYKPINWVGITDPKDGELIYNVDKKFYYYNGTEWKALGGAEVVTLTENAQGGGPAAWGCYRDPAGVGYTIPSEADYVIVAGSSISNHQCVSIEFNYQGHSYFIPEGAWGAISASKLIPANGGGAVVVKIGYGCGGNMFGCSPTKVAYSIYYIK